MYTFRTYHSKKKVVEGRRFCQRSAAEVTRIYRQSSKVPCQYVNSPSQAQPLVSISFTTGFTLGFHGIYHWVYPWFPWDLPGLSLVFPLFFSWGGGGEIVIVCSHSVPVHVRRLKGRVRKRVDTGTPRPLCRKLKENNKER